MIDQHQHQHHHKRFCFNRYLFLLLIFSSVPFQSLLSQDMESYLAMIRDGRVAQVQASLPDLLDRYPNHDGVLYLSAVVEMDGEVAVEKFQQLLERFPGSAYADDASLRIGEYLYSRGLYTQASKHLRDLLILYPNSEDRGRAADLMVKSYEATGELDSLEHYVRILDLMPLLEAGEAAAIVSSGIEPAGDADEVVGEARNRVSPGSSVVVQAQKFKPWVIQIGAYGDLSNAETVKQRFENSGFDVSIIAVQDNGQILNAVQIVRFATRAEAEITGQQISKDYGLANRVFYRP